MDMSDWFKIKHFHAREFDSPDRPGSGAQMQWDLVSRLDQIREKVGFPMVILSGYRTEAHNEEVGGVDGSAHTGGFASDIACRDSVRRFGLVHAAEDVGITRIGIAKSFIHLDCDPSKPQGVIWLY